MKDTLKDKPKVKKIEEMLEHRINDSTIFRVCISKEY